MKRILIILILLTVCPLAASSQTINAASCSQAAVTTALSSVTVDGTTVIIPGGTCIWSGSSPVTWSGAFTITLQGGGNTSGSDTLGNPTGYNDQTIIQDAVTGTGFGRELLISTLSGKSFRMTGITFQTASGQSTTSNNGVIGIQGSSHLIRIDHNHFSAAIGFEELITNGDTYPLIDHNVFDNTTNVNLVEVKGIGYKGLPDVSGDQSWADSSNFGTNQFTFIENNTFTGTMAFDCESGGRVVFRYNTLSQSAIQTHGTGHDGARDRACRAQEIYGNNIIKTGGNSAFLEQNEGGSSLWWGNTISGYNSMVEVDTVRYTGGNSCGGSGTYCQSTPPNGWGYCGSSFTGSTSVWDQNLTTDGHACLDGVGYGKGDLLVGSSFPGITDQVSGTQRWPIQASDPAYSWGNTVSGLVNSYWFSVSTNTAENREWYVEYPNFSHGGGFTGVAGIGCGPTAGVGCANPVARPSTCVSGVGYWNVTSKTLFVCSTGNVWNVYYTPFTYPHPLTAPTPINRLLNLDINTPSSPGTTLTANILNAGTFGTGGGSPWGSPSGTQSTMTVGTHQSGCGLTVPVSIGAIQVDSTVPTQSFAYNNANNFSWWVQSVPGSPTKMSAGGCIIPGLPPNPASGNSGDLFWMNTNLGKYSIMNQCPGAGSSGCGSSNILRIETFPANFSPGIPIIQGVPYWWTLVADLSSGGQTTLSVYNTSSPYSLVGTSTEAMPFNAGDFFNQVRLGNLEVASGAGITTYENTMLDYTNAKFPLGNGIPPPAPPTITGWTFFQDSISTYCIASPCTLHFDDGNMMKTSPVQDVWIIVSNTTNGVALNAPSGGGGTWLHCTSCQQFNAGIPRGTDAWYNTTGNPSNTAAITVSSAGSPGAIFGLQFIELIPPPGSTSVTLDASGTNSSTSCTTCTGVSLTTTGTDAVIQVMTDGGAFFWNSYPSPYLTDYNDDGIILNSIVGTIPAPSIPMRAGNSSYEDVAMAFKSSYGTFSPTIPSPLYTVVGHSNQGPPAGNGGTINGITGITCSPGCPSFHIPTTGTGNLLFIASATSGQTISSVTGGGTWIVDPNCQLSGNTGGTHAISCAYALSSTPGATSLNITMSGGTGSDFFSYFEASTSTNGAFSVDSIGTHTDATIDLSAAGFPLTFTQNDIAFQTIDVGGGTSSSTYMALPHTGLSGSGQQMWNGQAATGVMLNVGPSQPNVFWANEQGNTNASLVSGVAFKSTGGSNPPPTAPTPTCNLPSGTYTSTQTVTCTDAASVMCYTINSSIPGPINQSTSCPGGQIHYTTTITVSSTQTIIIIAGGPGFTDSATNTYNYTIIPQAAAPTCNPGSGIYSNAQTVTCSTTSPGAIICFTLNGFNPSTNGSTGCTVGTLYTGPIIITSSLTLNAVAGGTSYMDSTLANGIGYTYNITSAVPAAPTNLMVKMN